MTTTVVRAVCIFLAVLGTWGCGRDGDAQASSSGAAASGPCGAVLAAIDTYGGPELFPDVHIADLPTAEGEAFEAGSRPLSATRMTRNASDGMRGSGPDDGSPTYVVADRRAKAERLAYMVSGLDVGAWRLVVVADTDILAILDKMPRSKGIEGWWKKVKASVSAGNAWPVGLLADGVTQTVGRCEDAASAATSAFASEGREGMARALRKGLATCKCEGMDQQGFALVTAYMLASRYERLHLRWLAIDPNVFYLLPRDADVNALAARLASHEPIPPPPEPPPPPPPAHAARAH